MDDAIRQILKMIESGKITATEGDRLLAAMSGETSSAGSLPEDNAVAGAAAPAEPPPDFQANSSREPDLDYAERDTVELDGAAINNADLAQRHILKMLKEGRITSEDADRMLSQLGPDVGDVPPLTPTQPLYPDDPYDPVTIPLPQSVPENNPTSRMAEANPAKRQVFDMLRDRKIDEAQADALLNALPDAEDLTPGENTSQLGAVNPARRELLEQLSNGALSSEEAGDRLRALPSVMELVIPMPPREDYDDGPHDTAPIPPENPPTSPTAPAIEEMDPAERHVLDMLREGQLSATQADDLMDAIQESVESPEVPIEPGSPYDIPDDDSYAEPAPDMAAGMAPNMTRFRDYWRLPFGVALLAVVIFAVLMTTAITPEGTLLFGFVCAWSGFMLALLVAGIAFLARRAPWVHVRVKPQQGPRIAISLPLPLGLGNWGLRIARAFVDDAAARQQLDMAAEFITYARQEMADPKTEPVVIDVHDDDGDHVQVYIG